jgi:hypothetical protein
LFYLLSPEAARLTALVTNKHFAKQHAFKKAVKARQFTGPESGP